GRAAELAELDRLFDDDAELVTICGAPGVGKTRLAVRYAHRWANAATRARVWFCDLAEARSAEDICVKMSRVLDVSLPAGGVDQQAEAIGRSLGKRGELLCVLDNFEQIVAAAPRTVGRLIELAPEASFLTTSREPLRVPAERCLELEPLPL